MKLLAADLKDIFGEVVPPEPVITLGRGNVGISKFLNQIILIIFTLAAVIFLFMLVFSALQWLTSGGDKEKIEKAKGRLTNAIIGIVLLSVALLLARIVGILTGFNFILPA